MAAKRKTGTKPKGMSGAPKAARSKEKSLLPMYVGGGVLVVGLASLVWWSLPGNHAPEPQDDAGSAENAAAEERLEDAGARPRLAKNQIERPPRASSELAIITTKSEDEVRALATPGEIAKRLDVRHCGGACDAVKKLMEDEDAFDVDSMTSEDLILPPKDTLDTVAIGLTPAERESIATKKNAAVIRVTGGGDVNQIAARAAFATAAVLAEALDGFVYDETCRRIETKDEVLTHAIRVPLGEPVFSPRQIVVQLYRQEDATERMVSFGLVRFGAPDLVIRGANMNSGPLLTNVLNAAAVQLIAGKKEGPLTITLDEVAKVLGKKPADLNPDPAGARPVVLDLADAEREDAEPDFLQELVPNNGASRESWDMALAALFGAPPSVATAANDKDLSEVAKRAQSTLPAAIKRAQGGEGTLFVKGPFPIPVDSRVDGGPSMEQLWLEVASCDDVLCKGVLSNEPTYATNVAAGKTTSVKRPDATDWLIQQRDGGTTGGESIKVLRARATNK